MCRIRNNTQCIQVACRPTLDAARAKPLRRWCLAAFVVGSACCALVTTSGALATTFSYVGQAGCSRASASVPLRAGSCSNSAERTDAAIADSCSSAVGAETGRLLRSCPEFGIEGPALSAQVSHFESLFLLHSVDFECL